MFATGGNDNTCFLFETSRVLDAAGKGSDRSVGAGVETPVYLSSTSTVRIERGQVVTISHPQDRDVPLLTGQRTARHHWVVSAAVKAIAFCPWQKGLIAIGGGSNDRCIHFYHTVSGACLATIDCSAQVTSLVWSLTRREIAVTFGFPQPDHPYRIAVFAWPSCEQVIAIPWPDDHRALYAISYPGGPNSFIPPAPRSSGPSHARAQVRQSSRPRRPTAFNQMDDGATVWTRTRREGCIIVAASDASIKFHEIWPERRSGVDGSPASPGCRSRSAGFLPTSGGASLMASSTLVPGLGLLGGSSILETVHGMDTDGGDWIR